MLLHIAGMFVRDGLRIGLLVELSLGTIWFIFAELAF